MKTIFVNVPLESKVQQEFVERLALALVKSRTPFHFDFWHSFVPPHRYEFTIGRFTDTGVENMKNFLLDIEGFEVYWATIRESEESQ